MKRSKRSANAKGKVAKASVDGSIPKKNLPKSNKATKNATSTRRAPDQATPQKKRSPKTATAGIKHKKAEAPFQLYKNASETDVIEGMESIVNLLRGRKNIVVLAGAGISVR